MEYFNTLGDLLELTKDVNEETVIMVMYYTNDPNFRHQGIEEFIVSKDDEQLVCLHGSPKITLRELRKYKNFRDYTIDGFDHVIYDSRITILS